MKRGFKSLVSAFIVLSMLLTLICVPSFTAFAADPIIITTKAGLAQAVADPTGTYELGADIIFTAADFASGGAYYNGGSGFPVIGSSDAQPFTGSLDGKGYVISGLKINTPTALYTGLVGKNQGIVQNIALIDADITGGVHTGGIAAYQTAEASLSACYTSGGVIRTTASNAQDIGGIVGYIAASASISDCYNAAEVASTTINPAGIAGYNGYRINRCYNAAALSAPKGFGIYAAGNGLPVNSYGINTTRCFIRTDSGLSNSTYTKTDSQLRQQSTFTGFDFTTVWQIGSNPDYPYPELRTAPH
ncbi:MAG: hypothetical protein LBS74_10210, partial [Oscillospiraceae bacterium]|nr:hypothetical protein [Oscillospiraceae bacterium]